MTKVMLEDIVKRYPHIARAMKENRVNTSFYIGNRKIPLTITEEMTKVFQIIDDIYYKENKWIKKMIDGIKTGDSDIAIMQNLPWEKNAYYDKKRKFINKIFNCCICLEMVAYEDILNEGIA